MQELSQFELDGLEEVSRGSIGVNTADHVLQRLLSLGLIEQVQQLWLPLEMKRTTYRITPAGRDVLKARPTSR